MGRKGLTPPNFKDLTGMTFGRLTVIRRAENKGRYTAWLCQCSCGKQKIIIGRSLITGLTKSCGCLSHEVKLTVGKNIIKHGFSNTKLYKVWLSMIYRCCKDSFKGYSNYGGRGIKVCNEWLNDYLAFREWALKNGYKEGLTIERKDNEGNYEPLNCKWITRKEQQLNKRTTHNITINGVTKPMVLWSELCGFKPYTIYERLKHGWSGEDLLRPVDKRFTNSGGRKGK